jgi:HAE1 family hydrophobic/amphiphilic exporter-1
MSLPKFAVRYPITVLMLVLGIMLLGVISFDKLGVDLFPDLNNPRLYVEIEAGERSPAEMESQYVERIESMAIRQEGVTGVSSICQTGSAQITVEYLWDQDMDNAYLDLQKDLGNYTAQLDLDEFTISRHDPNASAIMTVALVNDEITDMNELRLVAESYISNELIRLEGIAEVDISGAEVSEIQVETTPYLLKAFNVTTSDIADRIAAYNQNISAGTIEEWDKRFTIKSVSTVSNPSDIENIVLTLTEEEQANGTVIKRPVYIRDVAKVTLVNKDPEDIVRLNGHRCLGLSIYKESKYNTVKAVEKLEETFVKMQHALPGYEFTVVNNQGTFINESIGEVKDSALWGMLFAVIVLFFFLRRIGSTLIVSIAMPISAIATFTLMYFNGQTLNIMTLGGLALGIGMLVDNAIIVVENIFRLLEQGKSRVEAAIEGTREVSGAIIASTLTTIVVFLPIVYMQGASGELFKDQAWTVAFSLLSSLRVALLLIPVLSSRFFKEKGKSRRQAVPVEFKGYGRWLEGIIKRRWIVIVLATVMIAATAYLVPKIGSEFMPRAETREFIVDVTLPEGSSLAKTTRTIEGIERIATEVLGADIKYIYSYIGVSDDGSSSVFEKENVGGITVLLNDSSTMSAKQAIATLSSVLGNHSDFEVVFSQRSSALEEILGTDGAPLVISVSGEDGEVLSVLTKEVLVAMSQIDGVFNVNTDLDESVPEVEIVVDRVRAGLLGLTTAQISAQISAQLQGYDAGEFENQGEIQDITIILPDVTLSQLASLVIRVGDTEFLLSEVAHIKHVFAPKEIYRNKQVRVIEITAQFENHLSLNKVVEEVNAQLASVDFPPNYSARVTGEEELRANAFGNLGFALLLSIILVYMVMASQFESLLHPLTILLTIPLALVGSVWAFWALGHTFNMMAYIGMIMLVGIAVNDSIVLVDAIGQFRQQGVDRLQAIVMAGQNRIRPILMFYVLSATIQVTIVFCSIRSVRGLLPVASALPLHRHYSTSHTATITTAIKMKVKS